MNACDSQPAALKGLFVRCPRSARRKTVGVLGFASARRRPQTRAQRPRGGRDEVWRSGARVSDVPVVASTQCSGDMRSATDLSSWTCALRKQRLCNVM